MMIDLLIYIIKGKLSLIIKNIKYMISIYYIMSMKNICFALKKIILIFY